jgi:hypothetical protein
MKATIQAIPVTDSIFGTKGLFTEMWNAFHIKQFLTFDFVTS